MKTKTFAALLTAISLSLCSIAGLLSQKQIHLGMPTLEHSAEAKLLGAPFMPESDNRFNCIESGVCTGPGAGSGLAGLSIPWSSLITGQATGASGAFPMTYYKATFPVIQAAGTTNTPIVLPAKSIIRNVEFRVNTAILPSGTTIGFKCVSTGDLLAAADETGVSAGGLIDGIPQSTAATMVTSSAGCTVSFTTAVHTSTAGNITMFAEVWPYN